MLGVGWILGAAITTMASILVISILVNPLLPRLDLRPIAGLPRAVDTSPQAPPLLPSPAKQKERRAEAALKAALSKTHVVRAKRPSQIRLHSPSKPAPLPSNTPAAQPLAIGFYVNWDDASYQSLKRNAAHLDWLVPEWVRLQDGDDPLARNIDPRALDFLRREQPQTPILPLLQNASEGVWNSALLARTLTDPASRARLINALTQFVAQYAFNGICVDFEEVHKPVQPNLLRFMQELHAAFKPRGWIVTQAVPFDDPDWDYRAYAAATDYLMLMAYDQHWSASDPGSIAAQDWFERILAKRMQVLSPARTIICIGAYGYEWVKDGEARDVTFQEAVLAAHDSDARIRLDPATLNPHFAFEEENGSLHTIWFLDAVTAYNQMRAALGYQPAGFALWRLGSEDPSVWPIFGRAITNDSYQQLRRIKFGYDVDFEGSGEILQVVARPQEGARLLTMDPATQQIKSEEYTIFPSSYVIRRRGEHPGWMALTFDDGPDPRWTPHILDLLKQEKVPATFFIVGKNGQSNPGLVRRIVAEGHDIGNHTFTHPNLGEMPRRITDLELNATQRLIESLTGRSTRLFRPPYFGDAEPTTPDQVEPIARAERLGYLTVGLHVDPDDWARPGTDAIVRRTIEGVTSPNPEQRGQVVLLHDSGGDRAQTVEALPRIIQELRARDIRFVTVSQLAGLTRDQVMPPLPPDQGIYSGANRITFYTLSLTGWTLHWLFFIGIVLGIGRLAVIGVLAWAQWRRARRRRTAHNGASYRPFVSVVVPAYNEEKVIVRTMESLLASEYPHFEIIVINDGSSDRTSAEVKERFSGELRVRLFTKENAGKAEALNFGLRQAQGEVIMALDADTIFEPETVGALAQRFYDPRIGAVAGNAKVGNRINLITRWQALEYVTSQNLDRRAFASLNAITVVPGAVGAWRRTLLEKAGGFSSDTLAEDQDLTLTVRKLGYKIGYEENAIAWTEAPDTVRALAKQRFRWSFGTLQCLWKHRDVLFRRRYGALGWVAMPNVWIFQIFFPLISPVMDLVLLWTLAAAWIERLEHPAEYAVTNLEQVIFYYALFLAVDWLASAFAFMLERRERLSLLWWLFLQRFCYRQIMYYVMIKSVVTAVRGALVGWGKLARKATVQARP